MDLPSSAQIDAYFQAQEAEDSVGDYSSNDNGAYFPMRGVNPFHSNEEDEVSGT